MRFATAILRAEAINVGIDPGYTLMTEAETILFFRKNIFKFDLSYFRPYGNPNEVYRRNDPAFQQTQR